MQRQFRPRLFYLSALFIAFLALYGWSTYGSGPLRALADGECPTVSLTWQASTSQLKTFRFSDTGRYFYTVDNEGTASVYSSSGARLFALETHGANRLAVAPNGNFAMAYSHLNPINSKLTFFDSEGKKIWAMEVDGAVWSAGACNSGDGACFVVGTGDKYVYKIDIVGKSRKYRRWRAPGVVVSMVVDPNGDHVTLGTWQDSSITRRSLTGKRTWSVAANSKHLQYIESIGSSDRIAVRSVPNKRGADGTFSVMDTRGKGIWSGKVKAREKTQVLFSPNGRYVCLGYEKSISHKGETTSEKHAALFDARGKRLWDKGSLLFHPKPLAVTSGGCVILVNEKNSLFTMNKDGELNPSIKLPAAVVKSMPAPDGSGVLLQCSDGKLHMLKISG